MEDPLPNVAVLGASGLIGQAIVSDLMRAGISVVPVSRRFTAAQKNAFELCVECPIVSLDTGALARVLVEHRVDIIVNCIGLLQSSGRDRAADVHRGFVARLVEAAGGQREVPLIVHLSIPGSKRDDDTEFSRTKRQAEHTITAADTPFVILRPGFVVAAPAYGGNALIRALAALPLRLSKHESDRPFTATDIADITQTIAIVVRRWQRGERCWTAVWDVMERSPSNVGGVIDAFRHRFGGPKAIGSVPGWLIDIAAGAGDLSAHLGWRPPICSTAIRELRRGVEGDPEAWMAATGIEPTPLEEVLARLPATVQERWFARLYLVKALILGSLSLFWSLSGLMALIVTFHAAIAILTSHGVSRELARGITIVTSLGDICIGIAVAMRKTCRLGLLAGIAITLCYLVGAVVIAPELWIDPLGSLVKAIPAIVLMLAALAILEDR